MNNNQYIVNLLHNASEHITVQAMTYNIQVKTYVHVKKKNYSIRPTLFQQVTKYNTQVAYYVIMLSSKVKIFLISKHKSTAKPFWKPLRIIITFSPLQAYNLKTADSQSMITFFNGNTEEKLFCLGLQFVIHYYYCNFFYRLKIYKYFRVLL